MDAEGLVSIRGLSFRYRGGESDALAGIDLEIGAGEFLAVVGPSGCGKSTLALAIGGYLFQQHEGRAEGTVRVAGMDVRGSPIYDVAEVVGLVQQNPETQFCTLTVQDEVAFGLENRCLPPEEIHRRLDWALAAVGASHLAGRTLASLSGGEKQKVAIAAVLAARPQLLILDEPTSNLDPSATAQVLEVIGRLRAEAGLVVIVIEHKLGYLLPFCPRLVAMEAGAIVYDGPAAGWAAPALPERPAPIAADDAPPVVEVEGLDAGYNGRSAVQGVSLVVRPGEIVALMGDNGAGKTTLLLSLLGLIKPAQGRVLVLGCDTRHTPVSRLAREVGLVFQNPDHQLFADSVWQEAMLGPRNLGRLDGGTEERARELLARSGLDTRLADHPYRLSYGQKRRLNLVSILVSRPRLILLDEVLIGQDPGNAGQLMGLLAGLATEGCAVIMAVHDPQIARLYATRLLFMAAGRVLVDAPTADGFRRLAALGCAAYLPAGMDAVVPRADGGRR